MAEVTVVSVEQTWINLHMVLPLISDPRKLGYVAQ